MLRFGVRADARNGKKNFVIEKKKGKSLKPRRFDLDRAYGETRHINKYSVQLEVYMIGRTNIDTLSTGANARTRCEILRRQEIQRLVPYISACIEVEHIHIGQPIL